MKIKTDISVKKLFRLIGCGLIYSEQLEMLIEKQELKPLDNYLQWTFEEFCYISESENDMQLAERIIEVSLKNKGLLKKLTCKKKVFSMRAKKYLEILKFAKYTVSDIGEAFKNIQQPPLSQEARAAGFGNLSFGDLGIARSVGQFEGIGTIQAYDLQIHLIIKSLSQQAQVKQCEHNYNESLKRKTK